VSPHPAREVQHPHPRTENPGVPGEPRARGLAPVGSLSE
jgi:hypothetical protein